MKYVPGSQSNTKKSLGQHWLHDETILQAIVDAGEVSEQDTVLEIGPGKGTLTDVLIKTGAQIRALEFDVELLPSLKKKFAYCENFAIEQGDIRKYDYTELPENYKVVANIPYYLTSNLIRAMSESANQPQIAVLLIQKEVAERICAKPGQMGILSVSAQYYFDCSLGIKVAAQYFTPPPKVDSQVVVLRKRQIPLFEADETAFFAFVKAGFSEKRKTLPNAFSSSLDLSKESAVKLLNNCGIKETARAQELSLNDWHKLYLLYANETTVATS
jgi:16S rRNA (adenine1518-N6/adenine1519-N6)-dimethyltransferase